MWRRACVWESHHPSPGYFVLPFYNAGNRTPVVMRGDRHEAKVRVKDIWALTIRLAHTKSFSLHTLASQKCGDLLDESPDAFPGYRAIVASALRGAPYEVPYG